MEPDQYGSSWDMSAMSLGGITAGDFSRRNKRLPVVDQVWGTGMAVPYVPIGSPSRDMTRLLPVVAPV
jgi:hypothetical protein